MVSSLFAGIPNLLVDPVFARRRAQLLYVDPYGVEQAAKWENEKKYIISKVIPEHLSKAGHSQGAIERVTRGSFWSGHNPILAAIEKAARAAKTNDVSANISSVSTGIEYELYCAVRRFDAPVGMRG